MEARELMLGDWVVEKGKGRPFRVTEIGSEIGMYIYGMFADGTEVGPFVQEEIEGIPLTEEILAKNGWNPWGGDIAPAMAYEDSDVELDEHGLPNRESPKNRGIQLASWFIDSHFCRITTKCPGGVDFIADYVHRLQHAYRLLGAQNKIML